MRIVDLRAESELLDVVGWLLRVNITWRLVMKFLGYCAVHLSIPGVCFDRGRRNGDGVVLITDNLYFLVHY